MVQGGAQFGFCPAKVLRDDFHAVSVYNTLTAILETNTWPDKGGLNDQESYWVEMVSTFGKYRRDLEFTDRYNTVAKGLTDGLGKNKTTNRN